MPLAGSELRVVVAPDKFKGSLEAWEVCEVVSDEFNRLLPQAHLIRAPIADGGEGTVQFAIRAGFQQVHADVTGPLGEAVSATYAFRGTEAVLEVSSAAGLQTLPGKPDPETAWAAGTHGVGELILHAVDRGARRVVVGAGGSASTDGGRGALEVLGLVPVDSPRSTGTAVRRNQLRNVEFIIACDVNNPLLGSDGAASVYGPQKGADRATLDLLEERLRAWADQVQALTGRDLREMPGAGAAGGFAYGLAALLHARLMPGIEVLMELNGLAEQMARADLVIVGEGSLDLQSLRGKGPIRVARSVPRGTEVVALVGQNRLTRPQEIQANLQKVYALTDVEPNPAVCMRDTRRILAEVTRLMARDWMTSSNG